jgi:hypothetical protein
MVMAEPGTGCTRVNALVIYLLYLCMLYLYDQLTCVFLAVLNAQKLVFEISLAVLNTALNPNIINIIIY